MSTVNKLKIVAEGTVKEFVSTLSEEEKKLILKWSEKAVVIRGNRNLSHKGKLSEFSKLEHSALVQVLLTNLFISLKNKIWTNQSWARRLGFVGLTTGISFGGAAVGIATMGAGIGVPLILMTAAGGVILGAAIDEIKKEL